jgi:hypothetical protein
VEWTSMTTKSLMIPKLIGVWHLVVIERIQAITCS